MPANSGIEATLRHELDSLPLPADREWFPATGRRRPSVLTVAVAAAALIIVMIVATPAVADWRQRVGGVNRVSPPALPTIVDGRGIAPLPNMVRHPELGFNLLLPANWRETARTLPSERGLVTRITFTAQSQTREADLIAKYGATARLPWDVVVEVWMSTGASATEFARTHDVCTASCTFSGARLNGSDYVATVDPSTSTHAYVIVRADRVFVLSYTVGAASEQPTGVTQETLEAIAQSAGLV